MKNVLIYCLMLLLILALFPAFAILITDNKNDKLSDIKSNTESNRENETDYSEDIVKLTLKLIDEDFCDESIKATLVIAENNLYFNIENNIKTNESLKQAEENEELKKKVENIYKETNIKLCYKNKRVFIPAVSLSSGNTKPHKDYQYIKSVASPWDCLGDDFVYGNDYSAGVSLNGIDYLCKNGMSSKEALSWYLPDFDIK